MAASSSVTQIFLFVFFYRILYTVMYAVNGSFHLPIKVTQFRISPTMMDTIQEIVKKEPTLSLTTA